MSKTIKLGIGILIALLTINLALALSCTITSTGSCSNTIILYASSNTNAHAQNISVATYPYGICCSESGQSITTTCNALAPTFLKLYSTTNAHVEVFNQTNYPINVCLGVTNRNVTCTYNTSSCSEGYTCLASIASSEISANNITNAHLGNCSDYPTKICCGYVNIAPVISNVILISTSGQNFTTDNLTVSFSATDAENNALYNFTDWRKNGTSIAVLNMPFNKNITSIANGAIKDYTTYQNNGTLINSPTTPVWTNNGKIGGAYIFDGTTSSKLIIPTSSSLNITRSITLSAWIKLVGNNVDGYSQIIAKHHTHYARSYDIGVSYSTLKITFEIIDESNNAHPITSIGTITANTWYQVTGTYDYDTGIIKIYINGNLDSTNTIGQYPIMNTTIPLTIGSYLNSNDGSLIRAVFNGTIDEVLIFDRALSSNQIAEIYTKQSTGKAVTTLVSNETSLGEIYSTQIGVCDGYECETSISNNITIVNTPPVINTATILPQPAFTNESLRGYCNATDANDATIIYHYKWYLNNILNSSGTTSSFTQGLNSNIINITNTQLSVGQNWTLECQANDTQITSNKMNSSTITIQPLIPAIPTIISPTNNNYMVRDRQPTFIWTTSTPELVTWYEINLTSNHCAAIHTNQTNIQSNGGNYTPAVELYLQTECTGNSYYNWTIRACNVQACSNKSAIYNFSIEPYLAITLLNNNVTFQTLLPDETLNTTNNTPAPFIFQNDGNTIADLTTTIINQSMWTSAPLGSIYMQLMAQENETGAIDNQNSQTTWINAQTTNNNLIKELNYKDLQDSTKIHIKITVPNQEPGGRKNTYITFNWI